jgi:hypothetical protein
MFSAGFKYFVSGKDIGEDQIKIGAVLNPHPFFERRLQLLCIKTIRSESEMKKPLFSRKKGQGVVEYAGALVIAAILVATVLSVGPTQMKSVYTTVFSKISTFFSGTSITAAS